MKVNSISNSIYFQGGLKKNLRQGEAALREYKEEFPYIKSNTYWIRRLNNINRKRRVENYTECNSIIDRYGYEISECRSALKYMEICGETRQKNLRKLMKYEKFGNCGEIKDIISENLDRKGIEHTKMRLDVQRGGGWGNNDHGFLVIGMKENADPSKPSTWGNKAVIIDGWMNFVLSTRDAIREYEKFFDAKYQTEPDTTKGLTSRLYFNKEG